MIEESPKLSIIITCYNEWKTIERAVHSAFNQTYQNKEIILVDDGSDSKTKNRLKKIKDKTNQIISIRNGGPSKARNEGIRAANGHYVMILDGDDFFEEIFAEKAIEIFTENKDIRLVTCHANIIDENGIFLKLFEPKGGGIKNFLFDNSAIGNALFLKRDWEAVKGYDEHMIYGYEDWEFYIRLLKRGGSAFVINQPLFNYTIRTNSRSKKAKPYDLMLRSYIIEKNYEVYSKHFVLYHKWAFEKLIALNRDSKQTRVFPLSLGIKVIQKIIRLCQKK